MRQLRVRVGGTREDFIKNIIFACVIAAAGIFLLWKCRFGIGNIDESFYLTVPYRLRQGDALFLHEWHLSQMAGVLLLPLVSLCMELLGGTEGIVLAMRYVCVLVQCGMAVFIYYRLKKISWIGALAASASFLLYIPFAISALSYHSMGIMFQVLSYTIILTAERHREIQFTIAGVLFAAAVLCCPYLVLLYAVYVLAVCVVNVALRRMGRPHDSVAFVWRIRGALFFTLGTAIAAALFAAFVLSRASLGDIVKAFGQIMNDPEHPRLSLYTKVRIYVFSVLKQDSVSGFIYAAQILTMFAYFVDIDRKKHRLVFFLMNAACVFALMCVNFQADYINHTMWAINFLAAAVVFMSEKPVCRQIFCTFWIPGMIFTFCQHLASNQTYYAIFSASSVATVGSIVMLVVFAEEIREDAPGVVSRGLALFAVGLLLAFQLFSQGLLRYKQVFWETGIDSQTQLIEAGPSKGILASEVSAASYGTALENIKILDEFDPEKALYLSINTWYCLVRDYEVCAYSAWLSGVNAHTLSRLYAYYELNPEKLPDAVYVDPQYEEVALEFCGELGYTLHRFDTGYVLTKP